MSVKILIKRHVPESVHHDLVNLLQKMRSLTLKQPGYISGRTLFNVENPQDCLVISEWQTLEDWYRWMKNPERDAIQDKIDAEIGEATEYSVYAPMVAPK